MDYAPSEDPVEAMSLLAAAVVTESELTIRRVPVEFLEIELAVLEEMGLDHDRTAEYAADNGRTRLIDLTVRPSKLQAPIDKIHPMPFPGLNIDNVPFFAAIAATAQGQTLIHDWVYDNRAIYLTDLNRLGGRLQLLDPHRVLVEGPTRWRAAEMMCPPALRPAVVVLLAMMAAEGTSVLRNVYVINRGYEDLAERLNSVGAQIEIVPRHLSDGCRRTLSDLHLRGSGEGAAASVGLLWDFEPDPASRRGYVKTASLAALPLDPARGRKCAYLRSVNPGSE